MTDLIHYLKAFNRKERFWLLHEVLGFEDQSFRLDSTFRGRLIEHFGAHIPKNAYIAMDYHLDWLQMALWLAANGDTSEIIPNKKNALIHANQQDVDLLIAFNEGNTTQLILIEAKADTSWSNDQLSSKCERLEWIFKEGRPGTNLVTPKFVLMSPRAPEKLKRNDWPSWMKMMDGDLRWLKLSLPRGLRKVTRCNDVGKSDESGDYIMIVSGLPTPPSFR